MLFVTFFLAHNLVGKPLKEKICKQIIQILVIQSSKVLIGPVFNVLCYVRVKLF